MKNRTLPILVAAAGNPSAGDDSFGPRVAKELLRRRLAHVDVMNLEQDPSRLLELLSGRELLVIVDAIAGEYGCGRIIECAWDDAAAHLAHGLQLSSHGLSIADQIELARALGCLPAAVRFVGAIVSDFEVGHACSAGMPRLVKSAADCVIKAIRVHVSQTEMNHA
jgi:hydrogenase maturation protease